MRGSLTEIDKDLYRLRVYVGRNEKGQPIQRSRTFRGGKRAAQSALSAFVVEIETHELGKGEATVDHLLTKWLDQIGPERKPYTIKGYRSKVSSRLSPAFGATPLAKLTAEKLDRQYRAWLDEGLSPTTVHQCHAILAAALHQAVKWGWIEKSVALRASAPAASRDRPAIPTSAEMRAILEASAASAGDNVLVTAITLAALTGARRGELCALRWTDVDDDTLTIARSLTVIDGVATEGPTKTHQVRRIALDRLAQVVLAERRARQADLAATVDGTIGPGAFILSRDADGVRPCLPDGLTHGFSRTCAQLGLRYHFHQLRHFAATSAIGAGVDVRTVAGRLGHADASVTLRVYARALEAQDRAAADAIGRALSG